MYKIFFLSFILTTSIFSQHFDFFYDIDPNLLPVEDNTYEEILYEDNEEQLFQRILSRKYNEEFDSNFKIQKIIFVKNTKLAIITFNNENYRARFNFNEDTNEYNFRVYNGGSFVMYIYDNNNIHYSLNSYYDFKKNNSRVMVNDEIVVCLNDKQFYINKNENYFIVNYYCRIEIINN